MFDRLRPTLTTSLTTLVVLSMGVLATACNDARPTGPTDPHRSADDAVASSHRTAGVSSAPAQLLIKTTVDFSSLPIHGTFRVIEGADALGCEQGTFVDRRQGTLIKKLTCEIGRSGSFTIRFKSGPGDAPQGWWAITKGTDEFATLHGSGDFQARIVTFDPPTGEETIAGAIHHAP